MALGPLLRKKSLDESVHEWDCSASIIVACDQVKRACKRVRVRACENVTVREMARVCVRASVMIRHHLSLIHLVSARIFLFQQECWSGSTGSASWSGFPHTRQTWQPSSLWKTCIIRSGTWRTPWTRTTLWAQLSRVSPTRSSTPAGSAFTKRPREKFTSTNSREILKKALRGLARRTSSSSLMGRSWITKHRKSRVIS